MTVELEAEEATGVQWCRRDKKDTAGGGIHTYPLFYPSTRQDLHKMGKFREIIRQKCVRKASGIRQQMLH